LLTMTGQAIRRGRASIVQTTSSVPLNLQGLSRGTYLLRWRDAAGERTIRLVRQ